MQLSQHLEENVRYAHSALPIAKSFDVVTRDLLLGETRGYWIGINGFCRSEILQQIFVALQNPLFQKDNQIEDIEAYLSGKIGYIQASLCDNWETILHNICSGPSVLFIDGFDRAILLDARAYPARNVGEPDTERVSRGARDGFVETMLFNCNLIRRRIRSPELTFEVLPVGEESRTDVAVAYLAHKADLELIKGLKDALSRLSVTSLTMGTKSLEELLVPKKWLHPLPSFHLTERPDVACSFLEEGHIAVIVDNSPSVLILPCTIFQFTQSPEDYYKSPIVGNYFRFTRFLCLPISLLLLPTFLLLTAWYPQLSARWQLLSDPTTSGPTLVFYTLTVEFLLDLFQYSTAVSSSRLSGSLSMVGGLIIGDIAVELHWASVEILFYAAVTLLAGLSLPSTEFAEGIRVYRIFLIFTTAFGGLWGFGAGLALILWSIFTTPAFGGKSYFWPLFPFQWEALKTLLLRHPTAKAQPARVWKR